MRAPLAATALAVLVSCSSPKPTRDAGSPPPLPLPDTVMVEYGLDDAEAFLAGLRGQFRDAATAPPLPAAPSEWVERIAALPAPVRAHIPEHPRMRGVLLDDRGRTREAVAVRLRLEADPARPLGVEVALIDGGPRGSRYVVAAPTGQGPALALKGDVLVVADDAPTLAAVLDHLAGPAMARDEGEGLHASVRGAAFGGRLRGTLEAALESGAGDAIAAARAERARHEEAPTYGEPEQLVEAVADRARRLVAYLPDVTAADVRVTAGTAGVALSARTTVAPGSPLARALAGSAVGTPFGLGRLPRGTALAVSSTRAASDPPWHAHLARVAGRRLDDAGRASLAAAAERLAAARADRSVVALGAHPDGAFLLAAAERGAATPSADDVVALLRHPYLGTAIGAAVGCEPPTLRRFDASGRAPLCAASAGTVPEATFLADDGELAFVLAARPADADTTHGAARRMLTAEASPDDWFGEPDAERALAGLGDRVAFAVALAPSSLLPALGLFDHPGLRQLAARRAGGSAASPLLLGVEATRDGQAVVRFVAPPRALEEAASMAMLVMMLTAGE